MLSWLRRPDDADNASVDFPPQPLDGAASIRLLVVDDDENLRTLLRASFELAHIEVEEAENATEAARRIAERHPDVIVLDVGMPGVDGITFCRGLKSDPRTRDIPVALLTGNADAELLGWQAGAGAFLRKPFSPLALLNVVERLAARTSPGARPPVASPPADKQLLMYAQDFRHLLELERGQRQLLQDAYRETVVALAHALESKDGGTGAHSERVRRYASDLTTAVDPYLLEEPSLEYGFILHDVGKIAIPDEVLKKPDPLTPAERRLLETHPKLGEQMVGKAALLRGHGVDVVRAHHERWDGRGYPDGLAGEQIPLSARIFAVADALDAITSDRPYRSARGWSDAVDEIVGQAGSQFDPNVVNVFLQREEGMRRIYDEFNLDGRDSFWASLTESAPPEGEY
jgi:response regulator RpfG family c-di-GMP phosphodiesterase